MFLYYSFQGSFVIISSTQYMCVYNKSSLCMRIRYWCVVMMKLYEKMQITDYHKYILAILWALFWLVIYIYVLKVLKDRLQEGKALQIRERLEFALCCVVTVSLMASLLYFIYEIVPFQQNDYVTSYLEFLIKLSNSSAVLHMLLIMYGDINPRGHEVYVNNGVCTVVIAAWLLSVIPAMLPIGIIFAAQVVTFFIFLITWYFQK